MKLLEPRIKKWTRDEYYRMADLGWFRGKHDLLLSGEICEMAGQGNWHSVAIGKADEVLRAAFPSRRYWVRGRLPMDLDDGTSEPEPDIAVVPGIPDDYQTHPSTALLIVEVSDSSLCLDRRKAAYYAAAAVGEYWIMNLRERVLEVHRGPQWNCAARWNADAAPDASYAERLVLSLGETISPVAMPTSRIAVSELFPAHPMGDTF